MKMLYVTSVPLEYSSSANMRNIALITGLINLGHEVYTLSYKPEQNSTYYDKSLLDIKFVKRYFIELGKIHSTFTAKSTKNNKIKKIIYDIYRGFSIYDTRKDIIYKLNNLKIKEKFDVIISSSDPKSSHLLAEHLIKKFPNITKRWIQYWGDPFSTDVSKQSNLPKCIIKKEENRILTKCDKIVYVSPFTLETQKSLFKDISSKMITLPIPYKNKKIYTNNIGRELKLGYFGDYYSKNRNILPLYETAKKLNIELKICGNSDLNLKEAQKITIHPRQSKEKIEEYEEQINVLACVCNKEGTQIPGKVYHYAATNRPILLITDGEYKEKIKKYFEQFNRYTICENNQDSIENAIDSIKENYINYDNKDCFNSTNIAKEFLK